MALVSVIIQILCHTMWNSLCILSKHEGFLFLHGLSNIDSANLIGLYAKHMQALFSTHVNFIIGARKSTEHTVLTNSCWEGQDLSNLNFNFFRLSTFPNR